MLRVIRRLCGGCTLMAALVMSFGLVSSASAEMIPGYVNHGKGGVLMGASGYCVKSGMYKPENARAECEGGMMDSDGDGVADGKDQCPGTPKGVKVDMEGCPLDTDGDGVADFEDKCPGTPKGVKVGRNGCPLDSDGDGVPDTSDKCPGTPAGAKVDSNGCIASMVLNSVLFPFDKASLTSQAKDVLDKIAKDLTSREISSLTVTGHTDSTGSEGYNMGLSKRRAMSVVKYLTNNGVDSSKVDTRAAGESMPVATNKTREGRAANRRVEIGVK